MNEDFLKEFGEEVKKGRLAMGMSQEDLGVAIGVSRPTIAQVEWGIVNLTLLKALKLSLCLGISLDKYRERSGALNFMETSKERRKRRKIQKLKAQLNKLENDI